jgi:hypothetical protein
VSIIQPAPVHGIGQQPAKEQDRHLRHSAGEADETDLRRRIGELVDLPRHRHGSELAADAGQKQAGPEKTKITVAQRR